MKKITIAVILGLSSLGFAEENKIDLKSVKKDYAILCELSKLHNTLAKSDAFRDDRADLVSRTKSMLEKSVVTEQLKKAASAIVHVDPKEREKLWHQAARESGLKNWRLFFTALYQGSIEESITSSYAFGLKLL